jgi:hypothetical protein
MVKITNTHNKNLILDFAQLYSLNGKNKVIISDYSTLRVQTYGPKLSRLEVIGYFSIPAYNNKNGTQNLKDMLNFFKTSKDGNKTTQFMVSIVQNQSSDAITSKEKLPKFRGVIEKIKVSMELEDTYLIHYSISFLVYPFNKLTSSIRDVY